MWNANGMTSKKFKMDDGNMKKNDEGRWSHIPSLLLWMIKDRLNIADSARVAFVCKHWESISLSYPSKPKGQQQNGIVPWLMLQRPCVDSACEFVNMSTMERLTLNLTESCYGTAFLSSRRGWLLFRDLGYSTGGGRGCSIVLLNPHTNAKITIPFREESLIGFMTSFSGSLEDGTPQYVVSATMSATHTSRILYITRVSDKTWTEYSYSENGRKMEPAASLVVRGHKVYLLDLGGALLIFDIANLSWQKLDNTDREIVSVYNTQLLIMEAEDGEILMIDRGMNFKSFSFFKLNESQTGWEELSTVNSQDKRSWFLCHRNNHFSAKESLEGTNKVYELTTYYEMNINGNRPVIHIHDLTNHSMQDYKPRRPYGVWVDLGSLVKVPPNCVRYVPSHQYCPIQVPALK